MTAAAIFLTCVGATALLSLAVAIYLRSHLRTILTDLCGTPERANFWTVFSNVILVLVPLIFALDYHPNADAGVPLVFEISAQLKHALVGLMISIIGLGTAIGSFILRNPRPDSAVLESMRR